MNLSISEQIYADGQKFLSATGSGIAQILNKSLNNFIAPEYKAGPGSIVDLSGGRTSTFSTLIRRISNAASVEVPADAAACAVDVSETMDVETLRAAYARIAEAKSLKKSTLPHRSGVDQSSVTLGIIFAKDATVPLETLEKELESLNTSHPSTQWTDMVVILSKGTINYAGQFPGEGISGEMLPPAEGAASSASPPIYIVMVISPTESFSFNKMCSFITAHLSVFSPGAKLPFFDAVRGKIPMTVVTGCGYQYNVEGKLLPVPRQFYNDRYLGPVPIAIEDAQGKVLSTIQFLPWQNGGVILLRGKLPLEGFLIFLGPEALKRGGGARRGDLQLSNVLPINFVQFLAMLQAFHRQSNMIVKKPEPQFIFQKIADEGTSSPFIARVFLGGVRLRDYVFPNDAKRIEFDSHHNFIITELMNARSAAEKAAQLLEAHLRKIEDRSIVRLQGVSWNIEENIDRELAKHVEEFVNGTARALKVGLQQLAKFVYADLGFQFQKQAAFVQGLAVLEKSDRPLADYLKEARLWTEPLSNCRNDIEHNGWKLPKIIYSAKSGVIKAGEPTVLGKPVTELLKFTLDRVLCFVEEVTAHCLQAKMPPTITITETPLSQRSAEIPLRFQVTVRNGGMPPWQIKYHQTRFEET